MVRTLRRAFPVSLLLLLALQSSALAANVSIVDNAFQPSTTNIALGDSVTWTNTGNNPHTTTSDGDGHFSGPRLWDSPVLSHNSTFTVTFDTAGSIGYHCDVHTFMRARVNIPMTVSPSSGSTSTVFTIAWAVGSIPAGFNEDIQYRRNGGAWTNALLNRTGTQVMLQTTIQAPGTYDLRARIQNSTSGGASQYSPPVTVVVS